MKWLMPLAHKNDFHFNPSSRDFIVEEIPLYPFSGEGEHLILKLRKKELSTWEALDILCNTTGIKKREIGYAGLKDKYAMTIQYISIPAKYEERLGRLNESRIKILDTVRHNSKIRTGHLRGNRFSLRFKKVLGMQEQMINSVLDWIEREGMPNYFGMQRFGNDGDNWIEGRELAHGKKRLKDRKMHEFLISAYQSYLFNDWLSKRISISRVIEDFTEAESEKIAELPKGTLTGIKNQKQFFKLLKGDLMMHYPYGRLFNIEDTLSESIRFADRDISPTGAISGQKNRNAEDVALMIEEEFCDDKIKAKGTRRYAWVFPADIKRKYIPEKAHYELSFTLPKGSYATVLVAMLKGGFENRTGV